METNQNPVQENSAQRIALELEQHAERLYDPAEAARIVQTLTDDYFDPEYILLFGKLVGGTPHSDAMAYDLLVVVRLDSDQAHPALQSALQLPEDYLH